MTDNTENSQKKVHLIKQPKPAQGEAPAMQAPVMQEKPEEEIPAEKKKVVVMKKKIVLKKVQAKVVAHHDQEDGEQSGETVQAQPIQASSLPSEKSSVRVQTMSEQAVQPAVPPAFVKPEAKAQEQTHTAEIGGGQTITRRKRSNREKAGGCAGASGGSKPGGYC